MQIRTACLFLLHLLMDIRKQLPPVAMIQTMQCYLKISNEICNGPAWLFLQIGTKIYRTGNCHGIRCGDAVQCLGIGT